MTVQSVFQSSCRWAVTGVGLAAGAYATYVGVTWCRYGHVAGPNPDEHDELLDRFMPVCEILERHHINVAAPASVTFGIARELNLFELPVLRWVFKGRELMFRSAPDNRPRPRGLLARVQSLGWVVLAEIPGREIVLGAATKPWEANVKFRSVPSDEFAAFNEPDYVKIAWTLRADPIGATSSIFRTETRAIATDASARAKFRRYWSLLGPGIFLIRKMMLGPVRAEAEREAQELGAAAVVYERAGE